MDIQALGMLSNITAIVQKQNVNTIENDINVEKDFSGTLREQQINCVKEDIYKKKIYIINFIFKWNREFGSKRNISLGGSKYSRELV